MKTHKDKKIQEAFDSLEEIVKRIKPYMPKVPKAEPKKEQQWGVSKGTLPSAPKHNHVTSPF